jgi:hypothetical protein
MRGTPCIWRQSGRRPHPALASLTVRAIFYGYLTMIVTGIVYFSIIGLTHH